MASKQASATRVSTIRALRGGRYAIALSTAQTPALSTRSGEIFTPVDVRQIGDGTWSVSFPWVSATIPTAEIDVGGNAIRTSCACTAWCPHVAAAEAIIPTQSTAEVRF